MEEKLAEYGAMQERVRVEMEVKGGELRQVKERWQVRENECFQASMALEREAEVLCVCVCVCVCVSYRMLYNM